MAIRQRSSPPNVRSPGRAHLPWLIGAAIAVLLAGVWLASSGRPDQLLDVIAHAGAGRGLQPALFQAAPLRTAQGGVDLAYFVSTQSQTVYLQGRSSGAAMRQDYLHVDLWAIQASTASVAWRQRLRTFSGKERSGRVLPAFRILGADGTTLWLNIEGPVGVSLVDGKIVADAKAIEQRNPRLAGKLVYSPGYIAFGRNGLQMTLDDASQWRIDAADLNAAPRDEPVSRPDSIVPPVHLSPASTSQFQMRAIEIGQYWLGVLTDAEADYLSHPPVIPGRDPNERPGAMQQFLNENHVPPPLNDPLPQPYRLWRALTRQVSAAPTGWPRELPDNWGTRTEFSDYAVLPDSPAFLRAGLLREHRDADVPLWFRDPDSVMVLHADKLGPAGRVSLSRVSGPLGKPVWRSPLPLTSLHSVMRGESDLLFWGSEPGQSDANDTGIDTTHANLVRIDVTTGQIRVLELTAESLVHPALEAEPAP